MLYAQADQGQAGKARRYYLSRLISRSRFRSRSTPPPAQAVGNDLFIGKWAMDYK